MLNKVLKNPERALDITANNATAVCGNAINVMSTLAELIVFITQYCTVLGKFV